MNNNKSASEVLKEYWGYDGFRPNQEAIVEAAVSGKDVMVIMPTGGGKSICYQVPAMMKEGVCIVVSPLIALMKDQVDQLQRRGIRADAVFSGLTRAEIDYTLDNAVYGQTKFLYVAPERLETDIFRERVKKMNVALVAVDEAHCISQWGYDFRPSYLNIAQLREWLPEVPFMALTATATPAVREDIAAQLQLSPEVFTSSFKRKNISFVCRKVENKSAKLLEVLGSLGGSGIIYVRTRKNAVKVAEFLLEHDVHAAYYHAGLDPDERENRQEQWMKGEVPIMVCTNAFGMGIDKSAVRFVIHWDVPDSLEAYYQEAGRAGRDGKTSYAVLLYKPADLGRLKTGLQRQFPDIREVRSVYNALCNYFQVAVHNGYMMSYDFDLLKFARTYKLDMMKVWNVIRILEKEGYLLTSDSVRMPSRLKFSIRKADLYKFQVDNERWDKLIQALLRTYGGIMDHYTPVNESYLGDRLGKTDKQVASDLKQLTKKGILNYIPFKNNPTITLLKNRLPDKSVIVNREFWETRREAATAKVASVLEYCAADHKCRQQLICAYFGDVDEEPCGKCDNCIARKSADFTDSDYERIKTDVTARLADGGTLPLDAIGRDKGYYQRQQYVSAVRRMLDEGVLTLREGQNVSLNKV